MKKYIVLILVAISHFITIAQESKLLEFVISDASYSVGDSIFEFQLQVINKSQETVTILNPYPYFFDKHYNFNVDTYANLKNQKPYTIIISKNKKCKNNEVYRIVPNLGELRKLTAKDIVEIAANKTVNLGKIKIDLEEENFCKKREYKISISYNLELIDVYENSIQLLKEENKKIKLIESNVNKILVDNNLTSISFYESSKKITTQIALFNSINALDKKKIESMEYNLSEKK